MWSKNQQCRLAVEKALVDEEMPQFRFHDPSGDTYLEGEVGTSGGSQFTLRCVLHRRFPDEKPHLYVVSPHNLPKYGGHGTINALGKSHDFHTWKNGPDRCIQICHFKDDWWDASKTLVAVLIKGVLWCEAYTMHLKTGRPISAYCA